MVYICIKHNTMNATHLHLVITHLPIFGSILGSFVLAYGLWSKSNETKIAAYFVLLFSAIGAGIAYLTGEEAEETVENLQGIAESTIEQHEDFAVFALAALLLVGASALIGIVVTLKKSPLTNKTAIVILLLSLLSFGLVARTGYLGGKIRHTEVSGTIQSTQASETETED